MDEYLKQLTDKQLINMLDAWGKAVKWHYRRGETYSVKSMINAIQMAATEFAERNCK